MKVLIINGDKNDLEVLRLIERTTENIGIDNTHVIQYGDDAYFNSPDKSTLEFKKNLIDNDNIKGDYDLLLIAGGHGNINMNANSLMFNNLSPKGVKIFVDHCLSKQISFKVILLGTCFSANHQNDFKNLLPNNNGIILSFTTVAPHKLCSIAESIVNRQKPEIFELVTLGIDYILKPISDIIDIHNSTELNVIKQHIPTVSLEQLNIAKDYRLFLKDINNQLQLIANLIETINIKDIKYTSQVLSRINFTYAEIKNSNYISENKKIKIKGLADNLCQILEQAINNFVESLSAKEKENIKLKTKDVHDVVQDRMKSSKSLLSLGYYFNFFNNCPEVLLQNEIEKFNKHADLTTFIYHLNMVKTELKKHYYYKAIEFIKTHYPTITQSNDVILKSVISTSLCLYTSNKIYVNYLETIPSGISEESDLDQVQCANKIISRMTDIKDKHSPIKLFELPDILFDEINKTHPIKNCINNLDKDDINLEVNGAWKKIMLGI